MERRIGALAFLLLAAGCSERRPESSSAAVAPVAVRVQTLAPSEITEIYRASGTVRARYSSSVAAKITATILEVRVQAGDRVRAGQILVALDQRDLETAVRRAEAAKLEAQGAIAEASRAIEAARASLDLARATHRRYEDLLAKKSVSQQEFDESAARWKAAEAGLAMSTDRRCQAEARLEQVDAEIATARITLGYATLAAPFAGLVVERKVDPGTLATPGAPLLVLEQEAGLRLEASLDESRLELARVGRVVPVEIDGLAQTVEGRVVEVVPVVDAATRTFLAKVDLPPLGALRAGMFGRAVFPAGTRRALLVPATAVVERGQLQAVFVSEGGVAHLRLVTLGDAYGDGREALSGVNPGERVLLRPPLALPDGAAIQESESKP